MPAKNKIRGNKLEYEVVNLARSLGFKAKRAWGSDGRSLGLSKEVDVLMGETTIQCKRRKRFPEWLRKDKEIDWQVVREDRGEIMVLLPLNTLLEMVI